jgi:hypothetical protein
MPNPICFAGAQVGLQAGLNLIEPADIKLAAPGFGRIEAKSQGGYVYTAPGNRLPTATVPPGYFEGMVPYEGPMDGVCMAYILASYFGIPTPTGSGTNGFAWDFFLGLSSGVARSFYTYENGDANRAERALNMYANSLVMTSSKGSHKYNGNMVCGKKLRGITITGSPSELDAVIFPPGSFEVYNAASKAALDTAVAAGDKLLTPFPVQVIITFPDVATPQGRMNRDEDSFAAVNDKAGVPTFALKVTDEDDLDALADLIDTGDKTFFALQGLGPVIPGLSASRFELRTDFCGTLIEPETNDTDADSRANVLTFQNQHDSIWGHAHNTRLVTTLPSL